MQSVYAHQATDAAGPLQVTVGQEGRGYTPWSNGTERWVAWCYPYPRLVQVNSY